MHFCTINIPNFQKITSMDAIDLKKRVKMFLIDTTYIGYHCVITSNLVVIY